ncbi:hypothetical protein N8I77_009656 [Diaporthe amygdali]|uniref:Uncharacterized protein n=1 Tax=Phomopsis amygdali TaxID=1214568 RepID=A0AAD9SA98_PHOAM|nr:hypothetical protein N8I77_009656 [Diaporthe amygdali]
MSENRQPPGGLFNAGPAPRYMPPMSNTMPANNSIPDHGLNRNSTSQAVPPNRNITASNQAPGHVTNSNPGTQYIPNIAVPGNLPMYNGGPSGTAPQAPPRPMAPSSNMPGGSHKPSQGVNRNGQGVHGTYGQIMNNSLLPMSSVRSNSHGIAGAVSPTPRQRFNAVPQTPGQRFNAVSTLRYTPSTNSIHRTNGAVGQARPIVQPQSPYDLPASQYAPYQSVHQRLGSQPTPPNNNRWTVNQTLTPQSMLPSGSVPSSATYPPAMDNDAKRPANAPPVEPPKKRQRKAAPPPVPLAQQPQQANANPAAAIQTAETQLTTTQLATAQFAETKPGPPTVYLNTTAKYVIEPDAREALPADTTALAFDQAVTEVIRVVQRPAKRGSLLRSRPLLHLRGLTDAIEAFVARPDRRELVLFEETDLTNVRYVRHVEDHIWLGEYDRIPDADYADQVTMAEKERILREAKEKEERERPAPTLQEAQRDIFKYGTPGNGSTTRPGPQQ